MNEQNADLHREMPSLTASNRERAISADRPKQDEPAIEMQTEVPINPAQAQRNALALSYAGLAERSGLSVPQLRSYERGVIPPKKELAALASSLEFDAATLLRHLRAWSHRYRHLLPKVSQPDPPPGYVGVLEAAKILKKDKTNVYTLGRKGKLPTIHPDGHTFFEHQALLQFSVRHLDQSANPLLRWMGASGHNYATLHRSSGVNLWTLRTIAMGKTIPRPKTAEQIAPHIGTTTTEMIEKLEHWQRSYAPQYVRKVRKETQTVYPSDNGEELLTTIAVAEILGLTDGAVNNLYKHGKLKLAEHHGYRKLFRRSDVEMLVQQRAAGSPSSARKKEVATAYIVGEGEELLTTRGAGEVLDLLQGGVDRLIRIGKLPVAEHRGYRKLFRRGDVETLAKQRVEGQSRSSRKAVRRED